MSKSVFSTESDGTALFQPAKSPYSRALVDPKTFADLADQSKLPGVPDSRYAPTRRVILEASANVPFDANGHARLYCTPELNNIVSAETTSTTVRYRAPQFVKCSGGDGNGLMHFHADGKMYQPEHGADFSHSSKATYGGSAGCGLGVMHLTADNFVRAQMVSAAAIGTVSDPSSFYTNKNPPMGVAVQATDVVNIRVSTGDAVVNNIVPYIITVTGGVYIKTLGAATTGPLYSETDLAVTVPANSTYLVEWGVQAGSAKTTLTAITMELDQTSAGAIGVHTKPLIDFSADLATFYDDGVLLARPVSCLYHFKYRGGSLYDGSFVAAPSFAGENLETDRKYNSENLLKRVGSVDQNISEHAMGHYFPTGDHSFAFRTYRENQSDSGLPEVSYDDMCSVVEIDISNSAARSVKVKAYYIVEILTTDRLHSPSVVLCDRIALDMALNSVHRLPLWHTNDFHTEFFRKALSKLAIPVSTGLGAILSPINPAASAGIIAGGAALKRMVSSDTAKKITAAVDGNGKARRKRAGKKR